jgi:hypothetical protein
MRNWFAGSDESMNVLTGARNLQQEQRVKYEELYSQRSPRGQQAALEYAITEREAEHRATQFIRERILREDSLSPGS